MVLVDFPARVAHPDKVVDPVVLADFPARVALVARVELVELEIRVADRDRLKAERLRRSH